MPKKVKQDQPVAEPSFNEDKVLYRNISKGKIELLFDVLYVVRSGETVLLPKDAVIPRGVKLIKA